MQQKANNINDRTKNQPQQSNQINSQQIQQISDEIKNLRFEMTNKMNSVVI